MDPATKKYVMVGAWVMLGVAITVFQQSASIATRQKIQPYVGAIIAIVFGGLMYFLAGSDVLPAFLLGLALVAAAMYANGRATRICRNCGATNRPRGFTPPDFCAKCGASLDDEMASGDAR